MTTARDLISLALFDAGIFGTGQTPAAPDINNGLTRLNDMISQWQRQRWLIYHLVQKEAACTGAQFYTIGLGMDFDIARPDRLEKAYIRQLTPPAPNQPDWPLELVQSREAYSQITLKRLGSFPRYVFYDAEFPTGKVYPWPLPSSLYELHVVVKAQLQTFANLSTVYNMPEEYKEAIRYNLQKRFLAAYRLPADQAIDKLAASALNVIRNANAQIPVLYMPNDLVRPGLYNIFSDQTN